MVACSYEIDQRPTELGGGWRLRLIEDGTEVGGGVFPLAEYAGAGDAEAVKRAALADAMSEADAWIASRRTA